MASSSRPAPLRPRGSPPPPPPSPSPPLHDRMLALSLAPPSPSSPRPRKRPRLALQADGTPFPQARPSPTTGDGGPSPCTLCGKQFASYKALHGHMRCHPDRPWRGMTAPQHFAAAREPEAAADGLLLILDAANHVMMNDKLELKLSL